MHSARRGFTTTSLHSCGFTLIELMVVITIIGILAAVGMPIYQNVQKNARDAKRLSDIQSVQKALEQYYVTNGGYPWYNNRAIKDYPDQIKTYFSGESIPSDPNSGEVSPGGHYPQGIDAATGNPYAYYEYTYYNCLNNAANDTLGTRSTQYIICAKLINPQGKANTDVPPLNACSAPVPPVDPKYYCLSSSN